MRLPSIVQLRMRSLFRRHAVDQDLDEELRFHLEREVEERVKDGESPSEARRAAFREIGGMQQRREECRDTRGWNWLDDIRNDLRFGLRQLGRDPQFALTATLILALGICACVSIITLVDAAILKPLPYRNPERLLAIYEKTGDCIYCNLSVPDYQDWKQRNRTLASLDVFQGRLVTMAAKTGAVPVRSARVSAGFFRTLGAGVTLGRDFIDGEDRPGAPLTAILSHSAWQQHFGGDAAVIGRSVTLNRLPRTIVGVLPRDFHFAPAGTAEFFLPFQPESECDARRSCHGIYGIGRLRDGVSPQAALQDLTAIASQLEKEYPNSNLNQGANVRTLTESLVGDIRPVLMLLAAGAALLLTIAVVNVAGLLLVRGESRTREVAVRSALGASMQRLTAQFATESFLLVSIAGAAGLAAAGFVARLLVGLMPEDMLAALPFLADLTWNWRTVCFGGLILLVSALMFAAAPSARLWMQKLRAGLQESARGTTGRVWRNFGSRLAVLQLAVALVLLTAAGLLAKSLDQLLSVRLGFDPRTLQSVSVAATDPKYRGGDAASRLVRTMLEQARAVPGVQSAGAVSNGDLVTHNGNTTWIWVEGRDHLDDRIEAPQRDVTPTYFATIGAKLAAGRHFSEDDIAGKPDVAIVNQAFAQRFLANQDPLRARLHKRTERRIQIVGVVEDIRQGPLNTPIPPVLYRPFDQSSDSYFTLTVRAQGDGALPAIETAARQVDPDIVTRQASTVADSIRRSQAAYLQRSMAWLVGLFAGAALLLALVGLYGVTAYSVSQRRREFGVRIALGAQTGEIFRMVARESAKLAAAGILIGLALSALLSNLIRQLLFQVSPWDLGTIATIVLLLGALSQAASLEPARQAASVDPAESLRCE